MKTRTLLLLSVGVGLTILLAGGVFLFQLSNESATVEVAEVGEQIEVGDVVVTVGGATEANGMVIVDVELGGVADSNGIESFDLITGADRIMAESAAVEGRCREITTAPQRCRLDFDVRTVEGSNRVLVLRRGDQQRRWDLGLD